MRIEDVRYATSGDLRIAYQEFGSGDLELVFVPGFISNLDMAWEVDTMVPRAQAMALAILRLDFPSRTNRVPS